MTLQLHDITHAFGQHTVLKNINASSASGRITALVGPNAAGKTTLLRIASGLLGADQGSVRFQEADLSTLNETQRAGQIAVLPQRPRSDIPLRVREIIALGRHGRSARGMKTVAEQLELGAVLDRPYQSLSVGQQQRVGIARLLHQHEPGGLLVLDEPNAPLDPRHAMTLIRLLRSAADEGATVVLSMHDLALAASVADDAWILDNGEIVHSGHVDDVLIPEHLEAAFDVRFERLQRADGSGWLAPEA